MRRADGDALTAHDLRRLEKYAQSLVDHHLVADLVPPLARAYFGGKVPATMSYAQTAIVLTVGLQHKEMDDAARELGLPTPQVMALFNKAVRKMHAALRAGKTREVEADMPKESALPNLNPHAVGLDEDLEDGYVSTRLAFFGFSRHSRSLRSRLADAPGTTKMRRDGSDGYNPGRRSPEVASAGATVYSGL